MDKKYGKFKMGELFDIKGVRQAKSQSAIPTDSNGIPYVVQTQSNNMVSRFVNEQYLIDNNEPICDGNVIVLGVTLPAVSYQKYKFGASQVITARADFLNEKRGLFFVSVLEQHMHKFSYNNKPGIQIYKDMELGLPLVDGTTDEIDFDYMESCISELEQERISELEQERISELDAYLKITGLNDYALSPAENKILEKKCTFKEFPVLDFFDIKKGKRLTKANMINGDINFIGSTAENNGVTAKIGNTEHLHPGGTFTVSYNGSVGEVFYQESTFWASDDVNVWYPKENWSPEVLQYFMSSIKKLGIKYSYTSKWTLDKMKAETIMLPVTASGKVDFNYMESYIKAIEKEVVAGVVKYKDSIIETTKKVVGV